MNANVRIEEITPLGDFVLTSYARDFDVIKGRFPKLDEAFKDGFVAKLAFVKKLESRLVLTEEQKGITAALYAAANSLNEELNFLSNYFSDARLNAGIISDLKNDLFKNNIEGGLLKIEALEQFVTTHKAALTEQGMPEDYANILEDYKVSLEKKNNNQNDLLNHRRELTSRNNGHYEELLKMLRQITRKGKLIFRGTVYQDEYTTTKVVSRMRAPKRKEEEGGAKS